MSTITTVAIGADQIDYSRFRVEFGLTQQMMDALLTRKTDQVAMPAPFADRVELRASLLHGQGLYAKRAFRRGELVVPARIDRNRTPAGRYTNHSIRPNIAGIRTGAAPDSDIDMYAIRDIAADEELLLDYRQAGSVNGINMPCDRRAAEETVRQRLSLHADSQWLADALKPCLDAVWSICGYFPVEFVDWWLAATQRGCVPDADGFVSDIARLRADLAPVLEGLRYAAR